jgi:hypothetical protein
MFEVRQFWESISSCCSLQLRMHTVHDMRAPLAGLAPAWCGCRQPIWELGLGQGCDAVALPLDMEYEGV